MAHPPRRPRRHGKFKRPPPKRLSSEEADAIMERNQSVSPLLRLPGEIRNKIYHYVFRVDGIKIWVFPETNPSGGNFRMVHALCPANNIRMCWWYLSNHIHLTAVCRQIHAEAALLPYMINILEMDLLTVPDFVELVPKALLLNIKTVLVRFEVYQWEFRCDSLGNYNGPELRSLNKLPRLEKLVLPSGRWLLSDKSVTDKIKEHVESPIEVVVVGEDEIYDLLLRSG
ncbi:Nn.00g030690.m01.CDS01 [Neocucurbitaria sp. VM-36]